MATASELRAMGNGEIEELLDDAKEELHNLRFQRASGQLENTARPKTVRRKIARMYMILRERELAAQVVQEESNG